jgi:hypothetical protein
MTVSMTMPMTVSMTVPMMFAAMVFATATG